jgi:aconitate hydratase
MGRNVARQLIEAHFVSGDLVEGLEVALRVDQTLTQDATGTLVMLELEALGLDRARTEVSVQYVDHNLLQADERNAEDHLFLRSAARRFGLWFSKPGNGVSHPTHMQRFGKPGKTMLGSDSRIPALPDRWACWPSASAAWRSRWPSPANRCISKCRRSGACG